MAYWLFKSEPDAFSIDDLKNRPKQTEHWDGVRNYQARNMLKNDVKVGDKIFFYHSSCIPPGIAGIATVVKAGYPDPSSWNLNSDYYDPKSTPENPRWFMVDVKFEKKFPKLLTLAEIKANPFLKDMSILKKGNLLSITPVTAKQWEIILKMAGIQSK
jgi:predicted RNA-binding protein with PUA-like domain